MFGWSSVEALPLRFWRLTPFDVQHRDRRCRSRFTDQSDALGKRRGRLEFEEHDKYSFQAGQAKVSEDWSHLLELNLRNVITMRLGRDWATSLCSRTHAVLWAHDSVDLPVCHSLIHAVNFEYQNVLSRQTAAVAGQKRAAQ